MNECQSCHTPLPPGAVRCPRCNTPTPRTADPTADAVPFMDFGPFMEMESASMPPVASGYQIPSQSLEVGAHQQAQSPLSANQVPVQQSSSYLYPQSPHAVSYPAQALPVMPVLPALPALPAPAQTQPRRNSTLIKTLLIVLLVVLVFIGSGVIYYATVAHPAALHAQATTVAKTLATTQAQSNATAYANSPQGIYALATSGSPTINDSLSDPTTSLWANHSNSGGQCAFTGGAYRVSIKAANYMYYCTPISSGFVNFALQVQMTLLSGDSAGLMFRVTGPPLKSYLFFLNGNGFYGLIVTSDYSHGNSLALNRSTAIKQGYNQPNLLTVVAKGSDIYLFINRQYVTKISDSSYSEGYIGLFASSFKTVPTEATFSNAEAWDLS